MVGFFHVPAVVEGFAHRQVVMAGVAFDPDEVRVVGECIFCEPFYGMGAALLTSCLVFESQVKQAGRVFKVEKTEHADDGLVFVLDEEGLCAFVCVVTL